MLGNFKQSHHGSSEQIYREGHDDINLYVCGMPPEITPTALRNLFESCGTVTRVKILPLKNDSFSTRSGFVCYALEEEAEEARKKLHGFKFGERAISVQYPQSKRPYNAPKNQYQELLDKLEKGPLSDNDTSLLFSSSQEGRNLDESFSSNLRFGGGRGKNMNQQLDARSFNNRGRGAKPTHSFRNNAGEGRGQNRHPPSYNSEVTGRGDGFRETQNFRNGSNGQQSFSNGYRDDLKQHNHGFKKPTINPKFSTKLNDKPENEFTHSRSTSRMPRNNFQSKAFHNPIDDPSPTRRHEETSNQNFSEFLPKSLPKLSHSPCRICGKMTQTCCSVCNVTHYCSQACQTQDWPEHSKVCKKFANENRDESDACSVKNSKRFNNANPRQSFFKPAFGSTQKNSSPASVKQLSNPKVSYEKLQIRLIPPSIKPNALFTVLVTDLDSENAAFVCQIADEKLIVSLNELQEELNNHFSSNIRKTLTSPDIGDFCAAKFSEDGRWYRAEIKSFGGNNSVQVRFIDYGNSEVVQKSDLKQLTAAFCKAPAYCLTCKLARSGIAKWSQQHQEFLAEVLQQNEMLLNGKCAEIVQNVVYTFFEGGDVNINEIMTSEESMKERDEAISESSKPSSVISELPLPKTNSTPIPNEHNPPLQADAAELDTSIESVVVPRLYELSDISSLKFPAEEFDMLVTVVDDPNSFFCQILSDALIGLPEFLQKITEYCQAEKEPVNISFKVGNLCCALFDEDQMWYRAQIVKMLPSNAFEVFYFDYGNTAKVSAQNIRVLPEDFMNLPVQTVKASLANCDPLKNQGWGVDAIEKFKAIVLNVRLIGKVMQTANDLPELVLYIETNESVNDLLVKEGFAVRQDLVQSEVVSEVEKQSVKPPQTVFNHRGPAMLQRFKPEMEKVLEISITCVGDQGVFYCHVVSQELEMLCDSISELTLYATKAPQPLPKDPSEGTFCAAYHQEEQTWYRAVIERINGNRIKVKYVDYGNTAQISFNEVKLLRDEFKKLPIQALPCVLANIEPAFGTEWGQGFNDALSSRVGKTLEAKFIGRMGFNYKVVVPELANVLVKEGAGQFCF